MQVARNVSRQPDPAGLHFPCVTSLFVGRLAAAVSARRHLPRSKQHGGVEAGVVTRVAGPTHLIDGEQHRVTVAVQPHGVHILGVSRGRSLDPLFAARSRIVGASRVFKVRSKASSSIQATINTSPLPRSWTTAVNNPSALRFRRAATFGSRVIAR